MSTLHVGDTGTWIGIDMGFDTTTATARVIRLSDPEGTITSHDASTHPEQEQVIRFQTDADTLSRRGIWEIQGNVQTSDGRWSSRMGRIVVSTTLPAI